MNQDLDHADRTHLGRRLGIALAIPIGLLLVLGVVLGWQILQLSEDLHWVDHSDRVLAVANQTLKQIIDQETGHRGYLVTGDRLFLEPYNRAHPLEAFRTLQGLVADNSSQGERFHEARRRYESWLAFVAPSLQASGLEAGRTLEQMREGKARMDSVREAIQAAVTDEDALRRDRIAASEASKTSTQWLFVVLLGLSAAILAFASRKQLSSIADTFRSALVAESQAREAVEAEAWIRAGQTQLAEALQGERTIAQLGTASLTLLASYSGADIGAFFTREGSSWHRRAGYGLDSRAAGPETFPDGEGLVGRAASEGKLLRLRDLPSAYLKLRSGLGEAAPAELTLIPARFEGSTNAVLELGFLHPVDPRVADLLGRIGDGVALAVRSSQYKQQLRELLEESQRQAEELQTQQEELRVANEELEAQTVAQRATQKQLETQQAELEQTNDHLLRQSETLERQNQRLADSQIEIASKAREVERASQFKSEFLSNMSHELRTPLNSSLILAKLLADNQNGNLTAEQVKFAQTIYGAGNDLLVLINDILDLSKIEAGKMEIHPASVRLDRLREALLRTFQPIADERNLRLAIELADSTPVTLETDSQRLEQILKNLISNALKFTDHGEVVLEIGARREHLSFAVRDTGIGIPAGQEEIIFEAFRQADGTTNRKYGGTGLGLSISRELARLLGGEISLTSAPGKGSTFTLTLPRTFAGPIPIPKPPERPVASGKPSAAEGRVASSAEPGPLATGQRVLLLVEDDEPFAEILTGVAREAGFECLIATTAELGIELARKHRPTGIVLDIKLPDHSGLSVLDQLKRDPATRHIPVHVISAGDHTEAALAMGAAAYLLKPVEREQLRKALQTLDAQSTHRLRRVLVVEDDPALRESVAGLLGRSDVEISTAGSVSEALALLADRTFDCVVTDLSLPDQSGQELLELMATQERYGVPPVIVYTGRQLTSDEEQRLRRYSRSIIIKGPRSPERLLDEVTLFLHQVESELPPEQQRLLRQARHREAVFEDRTLLIVEDDVRNVFALTSALEPKGARVVIARNGKEALAALERDPAIDLVLMDIMMPEMDGLEATRRIRKDPRWEKLPIIALTAKAMRDDQEKSLAAGANDYLAKPLDVEMLLSLLRVWMPKGG